jgi:hypothetical protein
LLFDKKIIDLNKPGFKDSSDPQNNRRIKLLKGYRKLKVWKKSFRPRNNYVHKGKVKDLREDALEVESMLKTPMKSLKNKRLYP